MIANGIAALARHRKNLNASTARRLRCRRRKPVVIAWVPRVGYIFNSMYQDFHAVDRWSGKRLHCVYQALIVAIATRHADAVDIKFLVAGRPVWIALPHPTWVEYHKRTGRVINDPLAIQTAGHFLKTAIENGEYEHGREMYTLTVEEALGHLNSVLNEVGAPQDALVTTA